MADGLQLKVSWSRCDQENDVPLQKETCLSISQGWTQKKLPAPISWCSWRTTLLYIR